MQKILKLKYKIFLFFLILNISFLTTFALARETKNLRVVSLAPSITETLIALGFKDNIVAISLYCQIPEGTFDKEKFENSTPPRLGVGKTFNPEAVLALKPDVILGLDTYENTYLPYHTIKTRSLDDVLNSFTLIAKLLNDEERGIKYKKNAEKFIEEKRKEFENNPKQRVLFSISRQKTDTQNGLIYQTTSTADNYFSELLKILNAENALQDTLELYPILNLENLQNIDPDIIVDIVAPQLAEDLKLEDWRNIPLKAVKNKRVFISHAGISPGPSFMTFLDELAIILKK